MSNNPNHNLDQGLDELAQRAWQQANGDALSAVKFLRDWTGLGLLDALAAIQETGRRLGKNLSIVVGRRSTLQ